MDGDGQQSADAAARAPTSIARWRPRPTGKYLAVTLAVPGRRAASSGRARRCGSLDAAGAARWACSAESFRSGHPLAELGSMTRRRRYATRATGGRCCWRQARRRRRRGRRTWSSGRAGVIVTLDDARPRATALAVQASGASWRWVARRTCRPLPRPGPRKIELAAPRWCPASPTPTSTWKASARARDGSTWWARPASRRRSRAWRRPRRRRRRASGCSAAAGTRTTGRGSGSPRRRNWTGPGDRPAYLVRIDGHAAWASS